MGIARFERTESADQIVVTAYAADDSVVGKIDLVHGVFDVLDDEGGTTGEVTSGRLVRMKLGGQIGFVQYLDRLDQLGVYRNKAVLPMKGADASMFVMDPHIKTVLDEYQFHFNVQPVTNAGELAYEYNAYDFQAEVGWDIICGYESAYTNGDGVVVGSGPSCMNPATGQFYGVAGGNPNAVCNNADLVKGRWTGGTIGAGATGVPWNQEYEAAWADLNQCCWRDTSGYFWGHKICAPNSSTCSVISSATGLPTGTCDIVNDAVLQQFDSYDNQMMYLGHQW